MTGATPDVPRPTAAQLRPFAAVLVIGLCTLLLPPYQGVRPWALVAALLCLGLTVLLFWLSLRTPERTWLDPAAAYLIFPLVALARDAGGGGSSGIVLLILIPLLWLAFTGTRRELYVGGVLAATTLLLPLLIDQHRYPLTDWRRAVTVLAIALMIGPVLQSLVRRLAAETQVVVEANRHLVRANERATRLFENAPHGVAVVGPDGRIRRCNDALASILGLAPEELEGRTMLEFAAPGDRTTVRHYARMLSEGESASMDDAVLRNSHDQEVRVSLSSRVLRHEEDEQILVITNVVDVSERMRYQERLAFLADHDTLTGLPNRRYFESEMLRHEDFCHRYGVTGAVLLLDLDNFKQVNDTLGHGAGDQLLISISGVLRRSIRTTDVLCRLGGDEFAVLLPRASEAEAKEVAQLIVDHVKEHAATLDGIRRRVTASVGVVTFQASSEHGGDALALADVTMYDAKEAGRNQVAVLQEGDVRTPRLAARLRWQTRIEEALEEDRFELHFQPMLDLHTNRITSAEALLRMREGADLISPARFLYIAERVGLAPQIDQWVIRRAIPLLARMRQLDPEFLLEVNLSGHSIGRSEIEETITGELLRHQVDPSALVLEVTETAAVSDVTSARAFAERMTRLGCRFALDDFGAGFGSFYYLKHLLFDFVKIDGEFVANIHRSEVDRTITRSIVGIARDLGKRTVAEFVSEAEILDVVREEGVDLAQGYFIGEPVPFDEFVAQHLSAVKAT